jgi:hypothetical protein
VDWPKLLAASNKMMAGKKRNVRMNYLTEPIVDFRASGLDGQGGKLLCCVNPVPYAEALPRARDGTCVQWMCDVGGNLLQGKRPSQTEVPQDDPNPG